MSNTSSDLLDTIVTTGEDTIFNIINRYYPDLEPSKETIAAIHAENPHIVSLMHLAVGQALKLPIIQNAEEAIDSPVVQEIGGDLARGVENVIKGSKK